MAKKSKTILILTVILAAGAAVAVPMAFRHSGKTDFSKMSFRQIREYIDSNQFQDANEQTQQEIRQQMGQAMQARMEKQVNGYFALADDEQRTAYLDKIIDDMQARREEFLSGRDANRPPDANGPPDPNRFARFGPPDANGFRGFGRRGPNAGQQFRRPNPAGRRARSEMISTETRVRMMQFRRDLFNRMQERGIQGPMMRPGGPGGFGPGGFGGPGPGPGGPP